MAEPPPIPPLAAAQAPPAPANSYTMPLQPLARAGASASGFAAAAAAAVPTGTSTTPPRQIITSDNRGSGLSSIANSAISGVAPTPVANNKRSSTGTTATASKRKPPPDFSLAFSDDNSLLSGDDEAGWQREEERVMMMIQDQNEAEQRMADELEDDVEQMMEMDRLLMMEEEGEIEEEETPTEYETILVKFQAKGGYSVKMMKEIALSLQPSVSVNGAKQVLFNRIRDCGNAMINKIDDDTFEYKKPKVPDGIRPTWVVLNPVPAPPIAGMNMRTGAQDGFFGPTNKENAVGPERMDYLTKELEGDEIKRPKLAPKDPRNASPSSRGGPSPEAYAAIPNLRTARPKDFFDTQITPEFVEKYFVACTNARVASEGAGVGGTVYKDWAPFDVEEMYKMMGVMFANGLSPKPSMDLWFVGTNDNKLYGNDFISSAMDKHVGRKTIRGHRRWQHFRRFLALYDFRHPPTKAQAKKSPLWKVQPLLDELNDNARKMWVTGKWVSIDEQTLGFKGRHGMKLRISYKREGDGFQCDAVCDEGYTFQFYFRHGEPPELDEKYKHLDLSPTAKRVVWLAESLKNEWTRIFMDNLFNSRKLFTALFIALCLGHGVTRKSGRGLPPAVLQAEEKNKAKAEAARGTTKAARLVNCPECPDLLAVSCYDTKPVNMLSTASETVEWVHKKRKIWSAIHQEVRLVGFLRLNFIDDYNNGMNFVDMSDQLRNQYRPDHWMRNRKWWWAFFVWALGVAGVNAWKLYDEMYLKEKEKEDAVLPPKWSHREFLEELVYDFIYPHQSRMRVDQLDAMDDESFASDITTTKSMSSMTSAGGAVQEHWDFDCGSGILEYLNEVRATSITEKSITENYFPRRLDGLRHASVPNPTLHSYCQYCNYQFNHDFNAKQQENYLFMRKNRRNTRRCLVCNVNLCPVCENEWHGFMMTDTAKLLGKLKIK